MPPPAPPLTPMPPVPSLPDEPEPLDPLVDPEPDFEPEVLVAAGALVAFVEPLQYAGR